MNKLRLLYILVYIAPILNASLAFADTQQIEQAKKINEISHTKTLKYSGSGEGVTWVYYPPMGEAEEPPYYYFRHYITIVGCEVSTKAVRVHDNGKEITTLHGTFNLTGALIPSLSDVKYLEFETIRIPLLPPYKYKTYTNISSTEESGSYTSFDFSMYNLESQNQPVRLLELLKQYQKRYCSPNNYKPITQKCLAFLAPIPFIRFTFIRCFWH